MDFLRRPGQLVLLPGAAEAIRRLRAAGYLAVVCTNQSGVARGFLDRPTLGRVHARLQALLAREGARIDRFYHCPHHPEAPLRAFRCVCRCRKPAPGLFERAAAELGVDLGRSVGFGDKERDIEGALAAGCRAAYRIATGPVAASRAAGVFPSLLAAADVVLAGR